MSEPIGGEARPTRRLSEGLQQAALDAAPNSGLRTLAHGFADDLVLIVGSATGLQRFLEVVSQFWEWSGMQIKLDKSVNGPSSRLSTI